MRRLIFLLVALTALWNTSAAQFGGLSAREIAEVLAGWKPETTINHTLGDDGIWSVLAPCYGIEWHDKMAPPTGVSLVPIAPDSWWAPEDVKPCDDMHNMIVAAHEVLDIKRNKIISPLTRVSAQTTDGWRTGVTEIEGVEVEAYMPPDSMLGDVARALMYAAAVYPASRRPAPAYVLMESGYWPLLTDYGKGLLLEWHRKDPPDDAERRRNAAITTVQGRDNPFVTLPEIAEVLWGDVKSLPADNPTQRCPLKGRYSISADVTLYLESAYVPEDALWYVDGVAAPSSVDLQTLGIGEHLLFYMQPTENANYQGVIKIFVDP